jgi:hypothetical protein
MEMPKTTPSEPLKPEVPDIPAENLLPLKIDSSEGLKHSGESDVWRVDVKNKVGESSRIALKMNRRTELASDEEMKASKEYYDYLKSFPGFGKFVPDTMYVKAQMTAGDAPRAYSIQPLVEGKPLNVMSDEDLHQSREVTQQLLGLVDGAIEIIRTTRSEGAVKPDFGKSYDEDVWGTMMANVLLSPRYSNNIVVSDAPDKNGQRVFFVDTGANLEERMHKVKQITQRQIAGRIQEIQLMLWRGRLKKALDSMPASVEEEAIVEKDA